MKRNLCRFFILTLCITLLLGMFYIGGALCCLAKDSKKSEYILPIIMYHHILKETSKHGKFVISPAEFEQDLKYLKENGYTTITADALIRYHENGEPLPEKPIMLTFDDGYLSYLEYAVPLLETYNMTAVVSVVGAYTDDYTKSKDRCVSYAHLTWEDIRTLAFSDHTEIQNHTYDMHKIADGRNGCAKKRGEDNAQYQKTFTEDVLKMRNLIYEYTGKQANCFTYPFGYFCSEAEAEIKKMGFLMSLSCSEGLNYINQDTPLYKLRRYNRAHNRPVSQILGGKK